MKATTTSKDPVKVSQIPPIMQEHFGQSMNLARIKLMALLLHALCVVQTVSLHKLADAMSAAVDKDSSCRRLQRFFTRYVIDLDVTARMVRSLLPARTGLVLSMDRTNWRFGDFNINILMLGVPYKGIVFSTTSGSGRRNFTISSSFTRVNMSILPGAIPRIPTVSRDCRSAYASTVPKALS